MSRIPSLIKTPGYMNPLIAAPATLLIWTVLLSMDMHFILGARITSSWIIVGVLFSLGAFFVLWILNDIVSGISDRFAGRGASRGVPALVLARIGSKFDSSGSDRFDFRFSESQRCALGLKGSPAHANRLKRSTPL